MPVDLGVDSPRLGEGAWASAEGLAAAVAVGDGETAVGRWGEVRLPHAGAPGEVAPATLHLGADLFLDPGTEVAAPLAGEVVRAGDRELTIALRDAPDSPLFLRLAGIESTLGPGDRVEPGALVGRVADARPLRCDLSAPSAANAHRNGDRAAAAAPPRPARAGAGPARARRPAPPRGLAGALPRSLAAARRRGRRRRAAAARPGGRAGAPAKRSSPAPRASTTASRWRSSAAGGRRCSTPTPALM